MAVPVVADVSRVGPLITAAAWLACAAVLVLLAFPRVRQGTVACAAAVASLAVTLLYGGPADNRTALWWMAELIASALTLRLTVRRAPGRAAALGGAAMVVAIAVLPLRLTLHVVPPATARGAVLGCVLCGTVAIVTAATALYPRLLDARRSRAVAAARRAQRLDLARDLHDFVAHDVSGMVVQAQAAQISPDPEVARAALKRIEDAGLRALASMDRTVHMLHETDDDTPRPRPYGLDDLPGLTQRFAESCDARISIDIDVHDPPREVAATAYRLVVEALTNVRRHAPDATAITVTVTEVAGPAVRVHVADNAPARTRRHRTFGGRGLGGLGGGGLGGRWLDGLGGRGLDGLAERVRASGGEFAAGPAPGGRGWEVTAVLPLGRVRSRP
ncbi:sensor histidine kinase [Actinomadura gamaensis]|uniref:histidine kinase n=1 Tax=Actinomadura gamaensis TaxID=1763541 RepID=A0ABV9U2Q0_9ACTN